MKQLSGKVDVGLYVPTVTAVSAAIAMTDDMYS